MSMLIRVGKCSIETRATSRLGDSNGCTSKYQKADEAPQFHLTVEPLREADVFESPWSREHTPIGRNDTTATGFANSYLKPIDVVDADVAAVLNAAVNERPIPLAELWDSSVTAAVYSKYGDIFATIEEGEDAIRAIKKSVPLEGRDSYIREEVDAYTLDEWEQIAAGCELAWFCEAIEAALARHGDDAGLQLWY